MVKKITEDSFHAIYVFIIIVFFSHIPPACGLRLVLIKVVFCSVLLCYVLKFVCVLVRRDRVSSLTVYYVINKSKISVAKVVGSGRVQPDSANILVDLSLRCLNMRNGICSREANKIKYLQCSFLRDL